MIDTLAMQKTIYSLFQQIDPSANYAVVIWGDGVSSIASNVLEAKRVHSALINAARATLAPGDFVLVDEVGHA